MLFRDCPGLLPQASTPVHNAGEQHRATAARRQAGSAGFVSHVVGCVCGLYLLRRRAAAADLLTAAGVALADGIGPLVSWLMGAPAGLKLHAELSSLLGGAALTLLRTTRAVYTVLSPALLPQLLGVSLAPQDIPLRGGQPSVKLWVKGW